MQFVKFLYMTQKLESGVQWPHTKSCFFEEMNSSCYIKLMLPPLFRELTEDNNMQKINFTCKKWSKFSQNKLLIFQDMRFIVHWEIMSAGVRPA